MKKLTIDNKKFKQLVSELARQISMSGWRPDYIVGITRGGLLPAVMLSHYFEVPCETLKVSLRDGSDQESNLWMAEDALGYLNTEEIPRPKDMPASDPSLRKNILIVDDINDTGATFNWIIKDWQSGCMPNDAAWNSIWGNNVKFAVVVDNASSNCDAAMNYFGMEIDKAKEDIWVDFPYETWWHK
jgi:xanthine phosphoribosyltransferase